VFPGIEPNINGGRHFKRKHMLKVYGYAWTVSVTRFGHDHEGVGFLPIAPAGGRYDAGLLFNFSTGGVRRMLFLP
jgi:hypothetical protein